MSKLQNSVTNKKNGSLSRGELTAKANSLRVALSLRVNAVNNGGRQRKQKGKYFKSAVFERTT